MQSGKVNKFNGYWVSEKMGGLVLKKKHEVHQHHSVKIKHQGVILGCKGENLQQVRVPTDSVMNVIHRI